MPLRTISSFFALRKAKRFFLFALSRYQKNENRLNTTDKERIAEQLSLLKKAILQKEAPLAKSLALRMRESLERAFPTPLWKRWVKSFLSFSVALGIAILIRTMWFELYTIPTGSMRPTLKEGDLLIVSKTDYGLNVPLRPAHFYFDSSLVQRGGIVVFSGENMDIADADTTYFYLVPGKKLFVKRLIGKPGDSLYFYGGKIYGVDRQGNPLTELLDASWAQDLEHIPFLNFEGKVEVAKRKQGMFQEATLYQMNQPVAKLQMGPFGTVTGKMISSSGNYGDLWGFHHFAMARLLSADQVKEFYPKAAIEEEASLYLELQHHPSLQNGQMVRDEYGRIRPHLGTNSSLLPLTKEQIEQLAEHLTTSRFIVKDGRAQRYGTERKDLLPYLPELADVPDGTYEIEKGKAFRVLWGSVTKEVPADHPLYRKDPERVQLLYNLGIEFITAYNPTKEGLLSPSRYAYFRNHELYLCGTPIVKRTDPNLILFLQSEYQKQALSTTVRPYLPFDDQGPPLRADGSFDVEFIRAHGLSVPENMYLGLGDNYAMSADSRVFGFIPEDNLRGGPSLLFWPRMQTPAQPSFPHNTFPNLLVWTVALLVFFSLSYRAKRKFQSY